LTKKPKNYINNPDLLAEIIKYQDKCRVAAEQGKPKPQQSDYLGMAFMKIAENFSNNYQYRNYAFRDEMIGDAIMFCVKSVDGFNPEKSSNPFSFFTTAIYFAFLQKIQKEKKQLYIKYKNLESTGLFDIIEEHGETEMVEANFSLQSADTRQNFIKEFEESMQKKKDKLKERKDLSDIIDED